MVKRVFDVSAAIAGLVCLSPAFVVVAVLIKLDSSGPVFFRQERIGRRFRPFVIYKFRTMVSDAPQRGPSITCGADPRITRIGRFLRRTKIDELPQLFNVLKGDMSIVGPRPEIRAHVERFHAEYVELLSVRPGLTDAASLAFFDEASVLGAASNPEEMYIERVLPEKLRLGKEYLQRSSLRSDVALIF